MPRLRRLTGESAAWRRTPGPECAHLERNFVPTADRAIGTDVLLAMAERIHPRTTVEVNGASRVVMISRPKVTTDLIVSAARSVRWEPWAVGLYEGRVGWALWMTVPSARVRS